MWFLYNGGLISNTHKASIIRNVRQLPPQINFVFIWMLIDERPFWGCTKKQSKKTSTGQFSVWLDWVSPALAFESWTFVKSTFQTIQFKVNERWECWNLSLMHPKQSTLRNSVLFLGWDVYIIVGSFPYKVPVVVIWSYMNKIKLYWTGKKEDECWTSI